MKEVGRTNQQETTSPPPGDENDLGRRRFFRDFAKEVFQASASVVGAANALQRSTLDTAGAILDPAGPINAVAACDSNVDMPGGRGARFPNAFRVEADRLVFIDQRMLPGRLVEVECRTAAQVAMAIRDSVVSGSLAIAQAAAYGLALTASRVREMTPYQIRSTIRLGANTLSGTGKTGPALHSAIGRMLARLDAVPEDGTDGSTIARLLRTEADAIWAETGRDLGRLCEHGMSMWPAVPDGGLRLLTHSSTGGLASGHQGGALGIIRALADRRPVHVYVCETRPGLEGARLAAWELERVGLDYTIVPDLAAASLLASGAVDAVLVGGEKISPSGDVCSTVGTYPLAVLAALHEVPFYACALLNSVEGTSETEARVSAGERPQTDVTRIVGVAIAPRAAKAWSPEFDVTPARYISAIISEVGVLRQPLGPALAAAAVSKAESSATATPPAS